MGHPVRILVGSRVIDFREKVWVGERDLRIIGTLLVPRQEIPGG